MSDSEIRALEQEALVTGDPEIAFALYRALLHQGATLIAPQKIAYQVEGIFEEGRDPGWGYKRLQKLRLLFLTQKTDLFFSREKNSMFTFDLNIYDPISAIMTI